MQRRLNGVKWRKNGKRTDGVRHSWKSSHGCHTHEDLFFETVRDLSKKLGKTVTEVFLALVWSNVHEESYLELVHWTPIKGGRFRYGSCDVQCFLFTKGEVEGPMLHDKQMNEISFFSLITLRFVSWL